MAARAGSPSLGSRVLSSGLRLDSQRETRNSELETISAAGCRPECNGREKG